MSWAYIHNVEKRKPKARDKGQCLLKCPIEIWHFVSSTFWFWTKYCMFCFCWFYKFFFHFTTDYKGDFNLTIWLFNPDLLFIFWISHFNHIIISIRFLLEKVFLFCGSLFHFSFHGRVSTTFDLWWHCNPITYSSTSRNNWKLLKFLLANKSTCNPNYGWFHVIEGELWLHFRVSKSTPFYEKLTIKAKTNAKFLIKQIIYLQTHVLTNSQNLELWVARRPSIIEKWCWEI